MKLEAQYGYMQQNIAIFADAVYKNNFEVTKLEPSLEWTELMTGCPVLVLSQ